MREIVSSKAKWIGDVPSSWNILQPRRLFTLRRELEHKDDIQLTPSQKYGVLPQTEYMEVTGSRVVLNLTGNTMQHVEPGDFISHLRTFQGGLELSHQAGKVSPAYTVVTPRPGVNPEFFKYVLKSDGYISQIASVTDQLRDGQSMRFPEFNQTWLPLPPALEQQQIADYLDHETAEIDAFIAELDTFADLLLQRKGAYREHLFGRFVTPTGTASLRGGLAEVDYRIGTNADPGSLLSVSISNGVSRWVDRTDDLPRATDLSNYKRVEPGDVVLNRMRAFQGAVGVSQWAGIASPDYAVLRTRPGFDPGFIEQIIRSDRFVQEIKARLRGIGNEDSGQIRTPRISVADLVRIPTSIPDIDTQIAHVHDWQDFEANTAERLSDAQHAIDLARERRAALITAAVTGQIDVTTKNKPAAEQIEDDVAQGLHREYA